MHPDCRVITGEDCSVSNHSWACNSIPIEFNRMLKHSREYRSVVTACILDIQHTLSEYSLNKWLICLISGFSDCVPFPCFQSTILQMTKMFHPSKHSCSCSRSSNLFGVCVKFSMLKSYLVSIPSSINSYMNVTNVQAYFLELLSWSNFPNLKIVLLRQKSLW